MVQEMPRPRRCMEQAKPQGAEPIWPYYTLFWRLKSRLCAFSEQIFSAQGAVRRLNAQKQRAPRSVVAASGSPLLFVRLMALLSAGGGVLFLHLLVALSDGPAQGEHELAGLGRAARGLHGDGLTQLHRLIARRKVKAGLVDAAAQQRGHTDMEHAGNLSELLKRSRALAALEAAKVELRHLEQLSGLLLREPLRLARRANVAADGLEGYEHSKLLHLSIIIANNISQEERNEHSEKV